MKTSILIRGQRLALSEIDKLSPATRFEEELIGFIEEWQAGNEHFLQYTSGSTGKPKQIEITRSQMIASALLTIEALKLQPGGNCLLCLSPQYIAGKMMIVRAILNKMNLVAVEPALNPVINVNTDIHFAALTPMQMYHVLQDQSTEKKLNTFDNIILGGGAVSYSLQQSIEKLQPRIYSTYGMTETVSHIALKKLNGIDKSNYYYAFEGIELNQDNRDCLTIKGPVTNNQKIVTNDRVQLLNNRQFEWLGRVDHMINSGGVKIQSEKVERKIEKIFSHLNVSNRFFIAGIPHAASGEQVTLFIEGTMNEIQRSNIFKELEHLEKYEKPKELLIVPNFIETPTGKINRKETITLSV